MIERLRTLDNIMRIDGRAPELAHLVASGQPFIATNVLADSFLTPIDDRDHVIRTFGEATAIQRGRPKLTVAEYFSAEGVQAGSITAILPPALEARLTELARRPPLACADPGSVVWIGRAGCKQRFHCDMDCAGIFLAQALGTKRVSLVSPQHTQKVQPGIDRNMLLSEVPYQLADDVEKLQFLAFVDGKDTILGPGETLFIPPLWWHFVEYASDSLAISWHSPPNAQLDRAAGTWSLLWTHEWPLWQGIVSRLGSDRVLATNYTTRLDGVLALLAAARPEAADAVRALHDELCPNRYVRPLAPSDAPFFQRRLERPLPAKTDAWRPDDVPRVLPYLRFASSHHDGRLTLLAVDGARVVGELVLDDDTEALAEIAIALDASRGATVAGLASSLECDVDDLCAALAELSARGWVTVGRSS